MLKYIVYAVYLYIINIQKVEDKYTFTLSIIRVRS